MKRRVQLRLEALEDRAVPSTVSWIGTTSGAWTNTADWSTGAVPGAGDDVIINQPAAVTVTLAAGTSIHSLALTGATLDVTGGTLAVAADSTNAGTLKVEPGARVAFAGNYSQSATGSLTLPAAGVGTGVGTNLLTNSSFESPTGSSTAPSGWPAWGSSVVNTQYAHSGAQSLEASGPNSGVLQSFAVTPGVSYTGTVYAMTPAGNKLTGPEGAFLQVLYYDAGGTQISSYSAPNSVTVLTSNSAAGGPISGSVGNQGWNFFSTTTVAPANAATVGFQLETGAYTGLSGTAGGAVFWDDPQFGPTGANAGGVSAANITNNGTMTIGAGDTVAAGGTFTQTSSGMLAIQLGGPPAGGLYGRLSSAGAATLGGTLTATLANGYSPAVGDGFNVVTYPSATGTFGTNQLPSGSSYAFAAAVNPTYVGLGAVPAQLSTTVNAGSVVEPVSTTMLGVNLAWWDDKLTTTQTQQMVEAAGLTSYRFPGGSSSDDYHFNVSSNFGDSVANTIPQFAQFIQSVGGSGLLTLDYGSGSPQEGAAELAYVEGSPSDSTVIGSGLEWNDSTSQWQTVNWQTVGYWASLRAASPLAHDDGLNFLRIAHPAAFSGINDWEVGNEEYGSWEVDHHGTAGPGGVSTGAQHDPATYAAFAHTFAGFAAEIDPGISIGIDSQDPTGGADNNWTKNVLTQGHAIGFVPGFISDHSYMQGPGQESDSTLLLHTVSDPNSLFDWSTRSADYQALLQATLGIQASSVQVMATEFNSVYTNPGKQSTSLVNGLFIADSIGSLLDSGYTGGFVWDLRNGWDTSQNNSPSLYGWRQGGDYGLLGDPNTSAGPSTGAYVPYPNYFAEQLASKIVQAGGKVVSASSNFQDLAVYSVLEANGHLELLVINKDPDANLNEQFTVQGFTPSGSAEVWQYGEAQDYAQSQTTNGSAALANFTTTLALSGGSFRYTFPAYSMTVLDLAPLRATAVGWDESTHGNWIGTYGSSGYLLANDATSLPSYAQITMTGQSPWLWAASTSDPRALQQAATPTSRQASTWYSKTSFTVDINLTDGQTHRIAAYLVDWDDHGARSELVQVIDPVSGAILDTENVSSFQNGTYLAWNVSGHIQIRITKETGADAVLSGLFLDPAAGAPAAPTSLTATGNASEVDLNWSQAGAVQGFLIQRSTNGVNFTQIGTVGPAANSYADTTATAGQSYTYQVVASNGVGNSAPSNTALAAPAAAVPAVATYVAQDPTTQGNWIGTYGSLGATLAGDGNTLPAYAHITMSGQSPYTWRPATTDVRALQETAAPATRQASCWYSPSSFTVDMNLADGQTHEVSIYLVDWDDSGLRSEMVQVINPANGAVLNSQTVSGFQNGTYMSWNITGHVQLQITRLAGTDAVLSGVFLDPPPSPPPAPTGLTATGNAGEVDLTWSETSAVQGFLIQRSTGGGAFAQVGTAGPTATSFADNTVTAGTSDTYQVIAFNGAGDSNLSNFATATPTAAVATAVTTLAQDTTTQGSWIGKYGSSGYLLAGGATSLPSYAHVTFSGQSPYIWTGATTQPRALEQSPTVTSNRIAVCWYSSTSFTVDINLGDGQTHQVLAYLLDWDDNGARDELVQVINPSNGAVLSSQDVTGFQNGTYLSWNITGHVQIRFTREAGADAVLSGLFLDPPPAAPSASASAAASPFPAPAAIVAGPGPVTPGPEAPTRPAASQGPARTPLLLPPTRSRMPAIHDATLTRLTAAEADRPSE